MQYSQPPSERGNGETVSSQLSALESGSSKDALETSEGNPEYSEDNLKQDLVGDSVADAKESNTATFSNGTSGVTSQEEEGSNGRPSSHTELLPEHSDTEKLLEENGEISPDHHSPPAEKTAFPVEQDQERTSHGCLHRKKNKSHEQLSVQLKTQVSGDFSGVSVVPFARTVSREYAKVDMHDEEEEEDDDEDSRKYGHISTTWVTSFWTQFTVLTQRTFKQSLPEILSKLNFIQVSHSTEH